MPLPRVLLDTWTRYVDYPKVTQGLCQPRASTFVERFQGFEAIPAGRATLASRQTGQISPNSCPTMQLQKQPGKRVAAEDKPEI